LTYRKLKEFSAQLEYQNRELDAQKTELTLQSTELMAQNTELEMQKKQLDEASRLKTNFLSNMSHELRTPLNSVIALSGVLSRRLASQIPSEEYSYLEVIERNGKHLLALINDILDIARIEAGREEIEVTSFNASNLIAEVVNMIQPQAEQKQIKLLHADSEADLSVVSDAGKCRHILQNLIANAVKFTESGKVEISARQSGNKIEITVTDTGIGIDADHLPHIFDEFRQADSSTSRKFGGTGLGLAIARKFANLLGGTITVTSTPGTGSAFTLLMPLTYSAGNRIVEPETVDPARYELKQASSDAPHLASAKTILLVEDSEPAIIQLKDILAEDGYRILVAGDGGEALKIISETVPDAMILDLMMPGVDGFEVLRVIREAERTAHIPVLILTAKHITKEELKYLKRNNVHQLIQKGDVNRAELQHAVGKMVSPVESAPAKPERALQTIEGAPTILVVEDNPDNMTTVKALLAGDYTVIEAIDGLEGVKMAKQCRPNLILMDIALPGMDGIAAFKLIRDDSHLQHIPVIALTASAMVNDRETILAHGFDAYIPKPINEIQLFRSIKEALYGV
jgi:signal transduction histidine kinase/DNA-binding response OmpR family regulator